MKSSLRFGLIAVALLSWSSAAQAFPSISQTRNYGPQTPDYSASLNFDQFHGLLIDLVSIEVILDVESSGGLMNVDNDAPTPAHVDAHLGADASISSVDVAMFQCPFLPVVGNVIADTMQSYDLAPNVGDGAADWDPSGPDGAQLVGGTVSDSDNGFICGTFFASGWVGPGTFDVDLQAEQFLDYGSVSGVEVSFVPVTAQGSVTIIYNYVPEPSTLALLALGGIALIRRR